MKKFKAKLKAAENRGGAYIEIPFNVEETYGSKRVKVKVTFDGYEYRGSLTRMGTECHIIGVTKAIRESINKNIGDDILITIEKDDEERVVEIPDDLDNKLNENVLAKEFWESLSFSNKKKFVQWITSAKKLETRENRVLVTVEKLNNKEKL